METARFFINFRRVTSIFSFNFLASLINGNDLPEPSEESHCYSFNFLASLINGNGMISSIQLCQRSPLGF